MYPTPTPFRTENISVDEIHTLHVEHYGNPDGVPVVFLHGGPGCSWSRHLLRVFDPAHYRVLAFDQRGAWRSTPLGELKNNTLQLLISDIERLREMIGVERWSLRIGRGNCQLYTGGGRRSEINSQLASYF